MRIANMGQVTVSGSKTSGKCDLNGSQTIRGEDFIATVYDHAGTQQAEMRVSSLSFVDVQPQGEGPYRVELTEIGGASVHLEVDGVGADDTVCVVNGSSNGAAGVCSAPPR